MGTTQHQRRPEKLPAAGERILKGFSYLTLDPSPRLRKLREEQENRKTDPTEVVRQAWQKVGAAIADAFRITRETSTPPNR
jgi:hypothetical protein